MAITKSTLRRKLNFRYDKELADFFGITQGALAQWGENDPIPKQREWQAKALRPDLFKKTRK
jgi:hypothetical protein